MQVKLNDSLVAPLKSMVDGIENVGVTQVVNKILHSYLKENNILSPSNSTPTGTSVPLSRQKPRDPLNDRSKLGIQHD